MIVDMMRNDLGRIAEAGSVQLAATFSAWSVIRPCWQMTSARAQPETGAALAEIFAALFPCTRSPAPEG